MRINDNPVTICDAYFSSDRVYRYWLLRIWDESLDIMANIGCNPSTAAETVNDPTVRKDMGFARRLGFGGLLKLNAGGYRSTDPKKWLKATDPFGSENTIEHIKSYLEMFDVKKTVVAWGRCIGVHAGYGDTLARSIGDVWCFGRNSDGTPKHTLMLPYATKLVRY